MTNATTGKLLCAACNKSPKVTVRKYGKTTRSIDDTDNIFMRARFTCHGKIEYENVREVAMCLKSGRDWIAFRG